MNNLEAKQEAIKKTYGENYIHADINGWIRFGMYVPTDLGIKNYDDIDGFWRCKSLQGIENNNGWIRIESEKDLPKESGLYFGKDYEFGTDMTFFDFETKKWEDSNGYLQNVTHYQPIEKPKPPIY